MSDVAGDGGQCCPCGEISGCTCDGEACNLECRKKAGTAELCGFDEFTLPSTPPKRYKKKTTSGSMTLARFGDAACDGVISVEAAVECRSKTVTATLCGYSEYSSPSTPPKKYRRQTISGNVIDCAYTGPGCITPRTGQLVKGAIYSGSYTFDRETCAETNTQKYDQYEGTQSGCSMPAGFVTSGVLGAGIGNFQVLSPSGWAHDLLAQTPTSQIANPSLNACFEFFGNYLTSISSFQKVLDQEDTEADAVARANVPASWATGGSCASHTSYRTTRTTGFSFTAKSAQTRIVISSGLIAGAHYEARVILYRRAVGTSDPFAPSGEDIQHVFEAAGVGYTSDWLDLPQDNTWEWRVEGVEVYGALEELIQDTWDIVGDFGPNLPASCAPDTEDNSARTVDGESAEWPFGLISPPNAYDGHVDVTEESTTRTTQGKDECQGVGEESLQVTGEVTETLEEEDTDEDAIERVEEATEWADCTLGCLVTCSAFKTQRTSGFTVGFSEVQTRVKWTAIIDHLYNIKVRFGRRLLGSTGPFLFHSLFEQTVLADELNETTDWIDVPNEEGWETVAINCSVKDVT